MLRSFIYFLSFGLLDILVTKREVMTFLIMTVFINICLEPLFSSIQCLCYVSHFQILVLLGDSYLLVSPKSLLIDNELIGC